jgi:DnaJ family protein C protein 2
VEVQLEGDAAARAEAAAAAATAAAAAATAAAAASSQPAAAAAAPPATNGHSAPRPPLAPAAPPPAAKVVVSAESGEWTKAQELALVQAMKQCGKDLSDRWGAVADMVPGKTKAQCFKRFKELKEMHKGKGRE